MMSLDKAVDIAACGADAACDTSDVPDGCGVVGDTPVGAYLDALASSDPTPGGGGVSALVGALGAALGCMVSEITLAKHSSADEDSTLSSFLADATSLRRQLLDLSHADAVAFAPLARAFAMPRSTAEEKQMRDSAIQKGLIDAAEVPLETMRKSNEVIEVLAHLVKTSSKFVISDVGCGAALCRAALESAALSVFINVRLMTDRERADRIAVESRRLLTEGCARADEIYATVTGALL